MILDITDDNGKYLDSLFEGEDTPERPDFFKSASFKASTQEGASSFDEDYALAIATDTGMVRKYPLMTKGAALASAAYFVRYGVDGLNDGLAKVAAKRIVDALSSFEVPVEGRIADLAKEAEELPAASRTYYNSQAWADKENPSPSLFDLFGTEGFEPAYEGDSLSPSGKARLWMQVKEAGLQVPEEALDYSSTSFGSDLKLCLDARKTCVASDEAKGKLDDIYKMASDKSVAEVVDALEAFDIDNGIQNHWGRFFPDPYVSVVGTSIAKTASSMETVSLGEKSMGHDEFSAVVTDKIATIKDKFGSALSDELEKDPVGVYNSLPVDYKDALANVLA